jgi:hypothetical protein
MVCIVLVSVISFLGCSSGASSLTDGQKKAVQNSITYIKNSEFTNKNSINTKIIKIENITEEYRGEVFSYGSKVDKSKVDLNDWVITIGSITGGHNFAKIVCDSNTYEVIGYIPID